MIVHKIDYYFCNFSTIKMPDFIEKYNFNSLYICVIFIIYYACTSNYALINIVLNKLYLLNYVSFIIIINLIGLYLILKNISFEISIKGSIKYK
jgi:hypothetical protein